VAQVKLEPYTFCSGKEYYIVKVVSRQTCSILFLECRQRRADWTGHDL